jgi:hypothetical protein
MKLNQTQFLKKFAWKVSRLRTKGRWTADPVTGRLRFTFNGSSVPLCPLDLFSIKKKNAFHTGRRLFRNNKLTYSIIAAADNNTLFGRINPRLRAKLLKIVGLGA